MTAELTPIARHIWDMKYRLRGPDGTPRETSIGDTRDRVAAALAAAEPADQEAETQARFRAALDDFRFMPAGRILAGAGTAREVTLFNCFVMGTIPDDLHGIFTHLREAAETMRAGGGIGYDFSTIRPAGTTVRGLGADASGPVSFMDVWDAMCRTIMSAGNRRGAMMGTLRCDHPDIETFIAAKADADRLRMFNLSVLVTDAFIAAVDADTDWDLVFNGEVYRTVRARALWDHIMAATYRYAEPGVIFIDRINARNNLWYAEDIHATNPCGEQPLPPYGACLLGSINLAQLVRRPFEADAELDVSALDELVPSAVRMLDNAIDVSRFPLAQQRDEARAKRRIGLGITGLADALMMCGLRYGGDAAAAAAGQWMHAIQRRAYLASVELARERGAFPAFERASHLRGATVRGLDPDVRDAIARHGVRNGLLTSVAPTGTISILANNVSSGLEPVFSPSYTRRIRERGDAEREVTVTDAGVAAYRRLVGDDTALPPAFVDVSTLTPEGHVAMQAAVQAHVDASVSKTINVPADISFEAFKDVYRRAHDAGCKGCTTYRPNPVTGAVLESTETGTATADAGVNGAGTGRDEAQPCPSCGGTTFVGHPGCRVCAACGASRCGV